MADCSPENFPWNQNSRIFQMVRTMNFGSVSPDPPKGHKNLDNCVRDETRAIHSVPHMQAGGQLARENGFFVSNNGPVAQLAIPASRSSPRPPSSETSLGRSRTPVHRPGLLRSSIERPRATLSGRERGASPPRKTTMFASRGISRCTTAPKVLGNGASRARVEPFRCVASSSGRTCASGNPAARKTRASKRASTSGARPVHAPRLESFS